MIGTRIDLVIIGSGALAAEAYEYISDLNKSQIDVINVLGFLDDFGLANFVSNQFKYQFSPEYLGTTLSYDFSNKNISYLIAYSNIEKKEILISKLKSYSVRIVNLIHPTALISNSASIGIGNIVGPHCIVGPNARIGSFNVITPYSFISHDCIINDNNFFSTVGLAGSVSVGSRNFFGIRATVIPNVRINDSNVFQAGMIIDRDVGSNETIFYKFKEKFFMSRIDV
jgi:acetyltransferase-like isoleucine patch superfamily enzyme